MRLPLVFHSHLAVLDGMRGYKQGIKKALLTDFYALKITYINQIASLFRLTLFTCIALRRRIKYKMIKVLDTINRHIKKNNHSVVLFR